jgi:hypothetical protein
MRIQKVLMACTIGLLAIASTPIVALAQQAPPQVVTPPRAFATAEEHYNFLKRHNGGGTVHTYESVPKWEGLWEASWNSIALRGGVSPFFVGPFLPALPPAAKWRPAC